MGNPTWSGVILARREVRNFDPDSSDAESIRTIHRALELGVTHIDTAEIYGPFANEELVGRTETIRRAHAVYPIAAAWRR